MCTINRSIDTLGYQKLQIEKIATTDSLEILCISLEKGEFFPEHSSTRDTHLIVLEGAIDFSISGKTYRLKKYEYFDFPANNRHAVLALDNSKFLIIR